MIRYSLMLSLLAGTALAQTVPSLPRTGRTTGVLPPAGLPVISDLDLAAVLGTKADSARLDVEIARAIAAIPASSVANILDFGAICDGASHPLSTRFATLASAQARYPRAVALTDETDLAAIRAAIVTGKPVYTPAVASAGCQLNATIVWPANIRAVAYGNGMRVSAWTFTGGTDGIQVHNTSYTQPAIFRDMSILTTQRESGNGLSINFVGSDVSTYADFSYGSVRNMEISGLNFLAHGWAEGIHTEQFESPFIQNNMIIGRRDGGSIAPAAFQHMAAGVHIVGNVNAIVSSAMVSGNSVYNAVTGLEDSGYVEGTQFLNNVVVGAGTCIAANRVTIRPWVEITGNHCNVFDAGAVVRNAPQSNVSKNLIYKIQFTVGNGATGATQAISLLNSDLSSVTGNRLINQGSDATQNGDWNGVLIANSSYVNIDDNKMERPTNVVHFTGSSTGGTAKSNMALGTYANAATVEYIDDSTGLNTRSDGNMRVAAVSNAAALTTTAIGIYPAAYGFSNVEAGQRYLVVAQVAHLKGPVDGDTLTSVVQAGGTATVVFNASDNALRTRSGQIAGTSNANVTVGIVTIKTRGTLNLAVLVQSLGGNGTVAIGAANMTIERM